MTKEPARKRRRRSHAEGCRFYFFRGAIFVFFSVDLGSGLGMGPAGNIFPNVAQPVFYSAQPTVSSVNVRRSRHAEEEKEEAEEKENHKTSVRG